MSRPSWSALKVGTALAEQGWTVAAANDRESVWVDPSDVDDQSPVPSRFVILPRHADTGTLLGLPGIWAALPGKTQHGKVALLYAEPMPATIAVDPRGCGCTECIVGEYVPLELATPEQCQLALAGLLRDHTSGHLAEYVRSGVLPPRPDERSPR